MQREIGLVQEQARHSVQGLPNVDADSSIQECSSAVREDLERLPEPCCSVGRLQLDGDAEVLALLPWRKHFPKEDVL